MPTLIELRRSIAAALALAVSVSGVNAQSFFPQRPDDPHAVDFTKEIFGAHADGMGDDAEPLQEAINHVQETRAGVLLIPEGRYRLGKTVYVWQGIRLIGYGQHRPVFVLGRNTPGFQEGTNHYMVHFADNRPQIGGPFIDASEFTFYSGMDNVDFELQDGNPAAIAIRFHVAQHSFLTHMDFRVGSARAALEDIGNQASDIHVHGGEYGIITRRTSPAWQFLLMDSSFDGQRSAAIHTMEAGFTLVRVRFANTPVALKIAPGEVEQLYGRDLQMENIRDAAFIAGNWHNSHSEVTLTNIACSNVPHFYEPSIKAPSRNYLVEQFSLGLEIGPDGREQGIQLRHHERKLSEAMPAVASDIPALPPMEQWVNVRSLGVKGEAPADDTAALQAAIEQHSALFFPSGTYRVSAPLMLRPDTVLIGLNPGTTQISLIPGSAAFAGEGEALGVVNAPHGGCNIISSLAFGTGARNPRAAGVVWMAGPNSMLDDVSFPIGGGGRGQGPPELARGDLIVCDGGGGIFRGCWTHNTGTHGGLHVENTSTPGKIYQMSVEHHLRLEAQFQNVHNWQILALQTEEENPAGADANALDIEDSSNLLFANTYMYRVSRNVIPKTDAAMVTNSDHITFQNVKVFSQTRLAFDNAVSDQDSGAKVRSRLFTSYTVNKGTKVPAVPTTPMVFVKGAKLEQLATGFSNASGLSANEAGAVFFTDAARSNIFRWDENTKHAVLLAKIPGQPQVLGFVPPSSLLAIGNERAVYYLNVNKAGTNQVQTVTESTNLAPGTVLLLPIGLHNELSVMNNMMAHRGFLFRRGSNTAIVTNVPDEHRGYYYAPETKTAIMAGGTWRPNLQSSQLADFALGDSHFLTSEDDGRTYIGRLADYRTLATTVFAECGGPSVVADRSGNVYVASGQVWIYDRKGKEIGVLEIPERPGSLAFGGPQKRILFIGARSSLYSIETREPGL